MAKLPRRKCAHIQCRKWFHPSRDGQIVCSYECAAAHGKVQADKTRQRARQQLERKQREEGKESRKQLRARKLALKTRNDWKREAQNAFNRYVRLRDNGKPCISCGAMPEQKLGGTMDCGHYLTRGARPWLAFNLHNTAGQCVSCNRDRAGAQKEFEAGLIERIGLEKVEALNCDNTSRKFTIEYFQRIKSIFTRKARALQKRHHHRQEIAA